MSSSFTVNLADLTKILEQIKIAERNAAGESLVDIIGPDAAILPMGLRTVDGSFNHLLPGQELVGAADQLFPRMLPADFRLETDGDTYTLVRADVAGAPPGGVTITNNNYDPTIAGSHSVADADLRIISNLIVDATLNNPAALQAALYASIVPAGTNDLNAAQGAELATKQIAITALYNTVKDKSAIATDKIQIETAYESAKANESIASGQAATALAKLSEVLAGVGDAVVDQVDLDAAAAAVAAANAAIVAQQAVIKTLQIQANLLPAGAIDIELDAAKALLVELHSVADAALAIANALALNVIDAVAIGDAVALATTASNDATTNSVELTNAEAAAEAARIVAVGERDVAINALSTELTNDGLEVSSDGSITIANRSPDVGLSPGFNGWMTFFGQFFDHGLDLVTKGNNGTIYIPLQADDPLYDKGLDGLVGAQQKYNADGNALFLDGATLLFRDSGNVYHDAATGAIVPDPVTPPVAVLYNDDGYGADGILGTVDDRPNFMALTRATTFIDPVTGLKTATQNTTTPFIDQNQTYTSISSHQVFLREYKFSTDTDGNGVADTRAIATGRMLDGDVTKGSLQGSIANWGEVKAQAQSMLGLKLSDFDVNDVPKLLADEYGKFIPGANGFAQVYVNVSLVNNTTHAVIPQGTFLMEGVAGGLDLSNLAALPQFATPPDGFSFAVATVGTGHAFLNDISHHAAPGKFDSNGDGFKESFQTADLDIRDVNHDGKITQVDIDANDHDVNEDGVVNALDLIADDHVAGTYDNEMLDAHFITGDGRGNENIGLTTVHSIFHSEHNRLVEANKDTIFESNDIVVINEWLLSGAANQITQVQLDTINAIADANAKAAAIDALNWNGERLFQAGRFATEMQYQHLVFEEFARKIQPGVNPFVFTNSADLDPAIVAEFAHVVYRFGHSMLSDTVDRLDNNLDPLSADPQLGLIQAFLNPQAFTASGAVTGTVQEASGAIIRGMTRQVGGEIDEFVVQAVRDNLVGLPLDLPALNLARGRDTGIPTFNHARAQFYTMTGDAQLKPYESWSDFAQHIKNPMSIINFIAAYGTHAELVAATTAAEKRAVATLLVLGDGDASNGTDTLINGHTYTEQQRLDFLNGTGTWNAENSGLNDIDLWIGGLAESKMEFGGMLGSTFNFVFETQLENLQNGDRFYYLSRTQGMNLLNQLEPNTFADLVMRNTSLGDLHSTHLNGTLFDTADAIIELDKLVAQDGDTFDGLGNRIRHDVVWEDGLFHLTTKVERTNGTIDVNGDGEIDGNVLKFHGGEHVVLGGTEGNDKLYGDRGIDTLWGDGGNDYINAGSEADQVFGGDGDDIIEDFFGDGDFLRGNKGNDVISDSHGVGDVLFGDTGKDFIMGGADVIEIFAGEGDDFVLGGSGGDGLMGNEGNDWIEGGEGFDGLSGENSDLFFNSPIIGHDVLNGQGNDTDYDGESGDDIMFGNAGITRANGMLGFDWVTQKGDTDTSGAVINLGLSRFVNQQALTLRDRADSVEGASGWKYNDTLIGTNSPTGAVGAVTGPVGGPTTDSMLLSQNVALINGLEAFLKLTPGALRGQTVGADATPFAALPTDTVVFNPQTGGDILLGGAGNDIIFGKAGNDLLDGDRWLNVRIEVHANKDGTGALVTNNAHVGLDGSIDSLNEIKSDMLAGLINPGQLVIVRELLSNALTTNGAATANDYAMYAGAWTEYTITRNANGTVTITDNTLTPILVTDPLTGVAAAEALLNNEGTDTLSNFEFLRFTNRDANGVATGTFTDLSTIQQVATGAALILDANGGTPTEGQVLTVNAASIADANGVGVLSFQWQVAAIGTLPDGVWTNIGAGVLNGIGQNSASYTPGQNQVGQILRVVVSFNDAFGVAETVISAPTAGVGDLFTGTAGNDNPLLTAFDDVASGLGGNDTLNGLAGNDLLDGGAAADILTGGAGTDTVIGGTGIDTLIATVNDGNDSYDGGTANDTYDLSATAAAATIIEVGASITSTSAETGTDTLIGVENFIGSSGGDTITVIAGANVVDGRGGNDIISTGTGADTIFGGAGNDTLNGESGVDIINGGDDDDIITGGSNSDILNGDAGNDTFNWSWGDGTDTINGGAGAGDLVKIFGRAIQNDTLTVNLTAGAITTFNDGSTTNTVVGVEGFTADLLGLSDTLSYGTTLGSISVDLSAGAATGFVSIVNIENATGGNGDDVITGNLGANTLFGGNGVDTLTGGGGADGLNGGAGGDILIGGDGADSINTGVLEDNLSDLIRYAASTEYGDLVNNFDSTGTAAQIDHVQFGGALNTLFDNVINNDVFNFATGDGVNNNNVAVNTAAVEALYLSGAATEGVTVANLGVAAAVAAEFNAEFNITSADGESTLLVINDTNANSAALWQWTQIAGGTAEIDVGELVRIGTINSNGTISLNSFDFI
jgi:Ca2+-binding RTX toxin-like protein